MSLTLSHDELFELTGYVCPAWQIKWLQQRGWKHEVSRKRPKVSRAYFEQRMGLQAIVQPEPELDFSCWRKQA
jgi:hypothetical protein